MEKLLTIVIPAYNMEKYLPKCIESVLVEDASLLALLDVIVVNDGSTDSTSAVGHRYAARFPDSVRVIDKKNGHHGSCVNCGLKAATGRFIRILDADDRFDTLAFARYLRKLIAICESDRRIDAVITPSKRIRPDNSVICATKCDLPENEILNGGEISTLSQMAALPELTYSVEMLHGIGYHQTERIAYSDTEWFFSPFAAIKNCIYINEPVYHYLIGREGQSTSESEMARNFDSLKELLRNVLKLYETVKNDRRFDKEILTEKVIRLLRWVFEIAVTSLPVVLVKRATHEALDVIRQCSPELESVAMSTSIGHICNFRYVEFIENHPKLSLMYTMVVRLHSWVARLVRKARKFAIGPLFGGCVHE